MPPHEFLNSTHDYKWFRFVIFKGYKPRPFWYCDDALDFCIQPMILNLKWISLFKILTKVSLVLLILARKFKSFLNKFWTGIYHIKSLNVTNVEKIV